MRKIYDKNFISINLKKCDYFHIFIEVKNNNIIASEIESSTSIIT